MRIGDKVIVISRGWTGIIVTEPEMLLGEKQVGIKFDNPEYNKLFNPYYFPITILEKYNNL